MVAPQWDLESLCPGGPGGPTFAARRDTLRDALLALQQRADALPGLAEALDAWAELVRATDPLDLELSELSSFAGCAASADARSVEARAAEAAVDDLGQLRRQIGVATVAALDAADDAAFAAFVARPDLADQRPGLEHVRAGRALRLPPALEALRVAMDREAVLGWGRLYDLVSGDLTAQVRVHGETRTLGIAEVGQLRADPDPAVRRAAYDAGQEAWGGIRELCAHTLTQITGNRLQLADRLGVDELASSLHRNRVRGETVDALWAAARAARPALVRYLGHKAKLLGKPRLDWWDLDAPLSLGEAEARFAWDDATGRILGAFDAFQPALGTFAREALDRRWVDAAPRDGRRPGGFCADLPRSDQSRIFMTFTGSLDSATTLAHELGHAFHNRVLSPMPPSRQALTSALAETASTFAEAVFRDHVLSTAADPALRAFMLDQQLQAALAFLMDIPHRFHVERGLYAIRRQGLLASDALSELTEATQEEWFGGALSTHDPLFWCSKLHFYIPEFGFYNWPYAFGYLFSAAVHARAKQVGPAFLDTLYDLLQRTGWQDTEELAREVLGVDLADPAFWTGVVAPIDGLVDAFVEATG